MTPQPVVFSFAPDEASFLACVGSTFWVAREEAGTLYAECFDQTGTTKSSL